MTLEHLFDIVREFDPGAPGSYYDPPEPGYDFYRIKRQSEYEVTQGEAQ